MTLKNIATILLASGALVSSSMVAEAVNPKPFVVPELRQWKGADGTFTPTTATKVVYSGDALKSVADQFAADYAKMFGVNLASTKGKAGKGTISIELRKSKTLGAEGYEIDVTANGVKVVAPTVEGARWATRTLLQMSEASAELPQGKITDYPDYSFRGFMLDCGRKYIPMDYLYKLVDVLAYYKMNVLHVHLNDNGFKYYFDNDWDKTQAAFRLESDYFPGLTARDGSYTKQEFRDFQKYAMEKGVEIVPEIDFPAHSLAFTRYRPEIGSTDDMYGRDHLDLMKPATYNFLDSLVDEYIGGENPVFIGKRFHIGTDEYSNRDSAVVEKFRYLTDRYIRRTEAAGKQPMVWGALTHAKGKQPVKAEGVEMYLWYNGYAQPQDMLDAGYRVVSIPDGYVYIVPGAGYYYDYLNNEFLYNNWAPEVIGNVEIDPKNPQLMGGAFAVWNDHPNNGITVKDIHHRIMSALPTMASKNWEGKNTTMPFEEFAQKSKSLSEAPGVNYLGRHKSENGVVYKAAVVAPGEKLPLEEIGYDYTVEFDLECAAEKKGTVLFESPSATVWMADPISGNMGYSREDKLNQFRFNVVPGQKCHVKITGNNKTTKLFVDGKLVDDMNIRWAKYENDKKMADVRTLVFPLAQAGDFNSRVTNLVVKNTAE